jgi:hypothetical protein
MKEPSQPTRVGRRRFLRGAGVALALPWMESVPRVARGAAGAAPPVRTAFIYFPNGVWEKAWVPSTTGADYALSPSLEPLADVKDSVLVLSGLDKKHSHGGDGHYAKTANFLTGMPVAKTTGKDVSSGGISIDQRIAEHLRGQTPLPSLELGTEPVISGIDSNVGYTRLYGSHISWQSAHRPVAKEINPRLVYDRLFGQKWTGSTQSPDAYRNLLDYVLEDAKDLRKQLGRDDQFKMDEFLDSVRGVEQRIEFAVEHKDRQRDPNVSSHPSIQPPVGVPGDFREHIEVMLDLMALAFQSDSTRVCSLMFANDVSGRNFSFLDGVSGGHHELSHHENNEAKIAQYQRINRWHTEQFARLLRKLKSIPEGDSNLLDHCMIVFGSSMSDGNRHDPDNLPILVGGKGGGALKTGQHVAVDGMVPLCNLYLTMLQKMGMPDDRFGDSTGPVEGI